MYLYRVILTNSKIKKSFIPLTYYIHLICHAFNLKYLQLNHSFRTNKFIQLSVIESDKALQKEYAFTRKSIQVEQKKTDDYRSLDLHINKLLFTLSR